MARKTVVTKRRRATKLKSAAFENAAEGGASLGRQTSPLLKPDEQLPDWVLVILLIGRLIVDRLDALLNWDKSLYGKRLVRRRLGNQRDRQTRDLRSMLIDIRQAAEAVFGEERSAELIATDGKTPAVPDTLLDQAAHALENLRDPALEVPEVKVAGFTKPDMNEWIAAIEPVLDGLDDVRGQIDSLKRQEERMLTDKDEAVAELDFVTIHATSALRGLFFLARMDEVAKRLGLKRLSERGPNSSKKKPPEDGEPSTPPEETSDDSSDSSPAESTAS